MLPEGDLDADISTYLSFIQEMRFDALPRLLRLTAHLCRRLHWRVRAPPVVEGGGALQFIRMKTRYSSVWFCSF